MSSNTTDNTANNTPKQKRQKKTIKTVVLFITCALTLLVISFGPNLIKKDNVVTKTYYEFNQLVESDQVESIEYDSSHKYIHFKLKEDDVNYQTDNPRIPTFKHDMLMHDIEVVEVKKGNDFLDLVFDVCFLMAQYGMIMFLFVFMFKKLQGGADEMHIETSSTNRFEDVAGLEEVKESLLTTVDMLKNPKKYEHAGARISKGILLYGPPGTGKTLLAKAIAGEAGVNFLATNGADFENKYVGVGADKIRKIFDRAKKLAPCIVFIDELDAVGCKRSGTDKSYERQTLNQLLSCMDGFSPSDGVFIFAATNDLESLDPALLRPGRFDSRFAVNLPDTTKDRMEIINLYLKNKKVAPSVSIEALAKQTLGCSPASIEAIINEAAIESVKNGGVIVQKNIDNAFYRHIMSGHKKKNPERSKSEIETIAWHEAGHALIGYLQNEEVSKISIVPTTSGAGGVTIFNPKKLGLYSKGELENHIRTLYAGHNAELLLNGPQGVTTGAANDIKEATKCIRQMVSSFGMSKYGLLDLSEVDITATELMDEYLAISQKMQKECLEMLKSNKDMLERLAKVLVDLETLDEHDILKIFKDMEREKMIKTEEEMCKNENV